MMKKLTIYFDLDHTLLDTERLKRAFTKALTPLRVTEKEFWIAYRATRKKGAFTLQAFIRNAVVPEKRARALRLLTAETRRAARFLYPDVLPFLRLMKKHGVRLVLFSYGHPPYIRMKIESIPNHYTLFDRILITPRERKDRRLPVWAGARVIIDNRKDVVRHYARTQGMEPFIITRSGSGVFRSLKAIQHALEKKGFI